MMLRAADSAGLLLPAVGHISAVYEAIPACVAANTQRNLQSGRIQSHSKPVM